MAHIEYLSKKAYKNQLFFCDVLNENKNKNKKTKIQKTKLFFDIMHYLNTGTCDKTPFHDFQSKLTSSSLPTNLFNEIL